MPMPVGGAFALHSRGVVYGYEPSYDPELEEFQAHKRFMQENLKVMVKFFKHAIPPKGGKVEGVMVLEAKRDIEHSGMFILMKGLPQAPKKRQPQLGKPLSNVKFTVLGSTYGGGGGGAHEDGGAGEYIQIEEGSRETYPLELDLPEDLPPPLITSEGKLMYKMQAFISTTEGRHVPMGEAPIRWLGCRVLSKEEVDKPLRLEQEVTTKRGILTLGRRRSAQLEWNVERGAYLPTEVVQVDLLGMAKDKGGLDLECRVELVQKVWYQVPSASRSGKMWVKMKVNILAWAKNEDIIEVVDGAGGEEAQQKLVWRGRLQVPKGITPTYKFDFTNSVCYTIRVSVGVAGESKEGWVVGELPLIIGSSKSPEAEMADAKKAEGGEGGQDDQEDGDDDEDDDDDGLAQSPDSRGSTSPVPVDLLKGGRRGSGGSTRSRRSMSMTFIPSWARPRAGSVSSMDSLKSFASSTLSIFRLPPSYSQLSSRRPTLETLPPEYGEVELHEQRSQSQQEDRPHSNISSASTPTTMPEQAGRNDTDVGETSQQDGNACEPSNSSSE